MWLNKHHFCSFFILVRQVESFCLPWVWPFWLLSSVHFECFLLGSRDGSVVRALASHQCVSSSIPGPGVICGLSLLLVLFLAPRGFSPCTLVFPSPKKPTFPNSSSIWIIVKHFIMSLWLGWLSKHSLCLTLHLHLHLHFSKIVGVDWFISNWKTTLQGEVRSLRLASVSLCRVFCFLAPGFGVRWV